MSPQGEPARVGLNLLWLVPGVVGGTEQAIVQMLNAMVDETPEDITYSVYALEAFAEAYPHLVERFTTQLLPMSGGVRPLRVMAEGTWLSRAVRRDGVDLMHYAGGTVPVGSRLPAVLTLHDVQAFDLPENFASVKRAYLQKMVPKAVREAEQVIVPCEFVREGIVSRFDINPSRVVVVPWGVEPIHASPEAVAESIVSVRERYNLPERWFIYPAITYPHKNHITLVRAFAELAARHSDVALVLTGRRAGSETEVRDEIDRLGLANRVVRTGRIDRTDLEGLLAGAVAMPFPSFYEGFGLPVLEAMAASTPVISSNTTALPEAVGDAGVLLDPEDVDGWRDALETMLDAEERERYMVAGRARAAEFSWSRTAAGTMAVHRKVLDELHLLS